jgi:N utilization substance protein B
MSRRSRAREVAVQVLYQDDLNPGGSPALGDALLVRRLHVPELVDFARGLVAGVRRHRAELDQAIQEAATNWSLHRMAPTDRNVLRLGAFELLHTDTPRRVVIDEGVELAKRFGTAHSAPFVNGILDAIKGSGFRVQGSGDKVPGSDQVPPFPEPRTPNPEPRTLNPEP